MPKLVRILVTSALLALLPLAGRAAGEKAFREEALEQAAIALEAQIRQDAGAVTQSAAQLQRQADAAFQKHDLRTGMVVLGALVTAAPQDAAAWLRLARAVRAIKPRDAHEQDFLLERAAAAAYIAYRRARDRDTEADSLALVGRLLAERQQWRAALDAMRLALTLRESADLRGDYERLRLAHGFRVLDTSVDADTESPRACIQFSEPLAGKRRDLSPFVAVSGIDKPALSVDEKQLCVEGLRHGTRYVITLRAGLPSLAHETLARSTELTVFVRDRKPSVRFAGRAFVLPRSGQRGIPVLSVNSRTIALSIYRIGDRNLLTAVVGRRFAHNLTAAEAEQIAERSGSRIWSGELAVEARLNTEVTTAFPVGEVLKELKPGVYVMTAVPKEEAGTQDGPLATQWFVVSDLGLAAYSGPDGIDVFVHSLASAAPLAGVELRLIARNNEELGRFATDANGRVHIPAGLARGEGGLAPALVVASGKEDYAFLSLKGPAFDLSDRGVAGRPAPRGLDAFVFTERGVYRSGETVHVTALLRDARGHAAAAAVPLTLVVERPDGVEYRRAVLEDQGLGGRAWDVPLVPQAMTGTWRVRALADPGRPPVGETSFLVEDYVPERLAVTLSAPVDAIPRNAPVALAVAGRFLYGAPAAHLDLEGSLTVVATSERAGFPGYVFGDAAEEVSPLRQALRDLPATDEQGRAAVAIKLEALPDTTRPLEARIVIGMAEPGGRAAERRLTLPIEPVAAMIGIRPAFDGRTLADGANADFDLVMVAPDGRTIPAANLHYELLRVETSYQWYRENGRWNYEPIRRTRRVADGRIDLAADRPTRLTLPVSWGRYRLEVSGGDVDGPLTALDFDAGYYAEAGAERPDALEIALDKTDYRPGETLTLAATARSAGRLIVNVVTDRIAASLAQEVKPGIARVTIPVGADWGSGAYVVATLLRPLDGAAARMPGRAVGVKWFGIDRAARTLRLSLELPATLRPNSRLNVPLRIAGLEKGEEARVVVAAVDVGILNLTHYAPPAPDDYFLGQRALATEIRDLYGELIDGTQGAPGRIRTGGDESAELAGPRPTQAPLALYSGIVKVGDDGAARVSFHIPAFSGTVRVMAVGWSKGKVGKAAGEVVVRDPVVLTATLPRFLRLGDRGVVGLELDNVEGAGGDYTVTVSGEGTVKRAGDMTQRLTLAPGARGRISVPVEAAAPGAGAVEVNVSGPNGFALNRIYALDVRPATQSLVRRTVRELAAGETLTLTSDVFADFVPGTGRVSLTVARSTALDAAALVSELDRYPFACTEQLTSRAMALLYAKDLGGPHLAVTDVDGKIRDALMRLLARQDANGSFGLWSVGGDDPWLDAYVADFLTRARERGFAVPPTAISLVLERLRNHVASVQDPARDGGRALAYALYVLARNGAGPIGDLRYLADVKLDAFATPLARAEIGAALAMAGDAPRAARAFASALTALAAPEDDDIRADYGSPLRDAAALVALASETRHAAIVDAAIGRLEAARAEVRRTSTQEDAWLVLAARALAKELSAISLAINGDTRQGAFYRTLRADELTSPFSVTNKGGHKLQAVVSVSGSPTTPEPALDHGFAIERGYYTLDGTPVDPGRLTQNERVVVRLKITEPAPHFGRVIVVDALPAGLEIDNPRLVSSGDTRALPWISGTAEPVHSEFRDDRFMAAFERDKDSPPVFVVAYVARAVSPGRYALPQALVEDMYRPDRYGRTDTGTVEITAAK